jgi:CBS domain-containing protein
MYVSSILNEKGGGVVTVRPGEKIIEIARTLYNERIGAAVVTDMINGSEQIVGIISERDVVNGVARHGELMLHKTVADAMTNKVIICSSHDTLDSLMQEMTKRRIRHIPVVEDGKLIGLVSIGDVVKYRLGELETESDMLQQYIAS